jgi:hypothetical protein
MERSNTLAPESLMQVEGDLLDFVDLSTGQFIAHLTDCRPVPSHGLAKAVFKRVPIAAEYIRANKGRVRGEIEVFENDGVINMYVQRGCCRKGRFQTMLERREVLRSCFRAILADQAVRHVVVPFGLDCGRAGDTWEGGVLPILEAFALQMELDGRSLIVVKRPVLTAK